jgi:hypothetical protein
MGMESMGNFKETAKESYKKLGGVFKSVKPTVSDDDDLVLPSDFTELTLKQIGRLLSIHRNHTTLIKNQLAKVSCYFEMYTDRSELMEAKLFTKFVTENKKASITEAKKTMRLDPDYNEHMEYLSELGASKRLLTAKIEIHEDVIQSLSRELSRRTLEAGQDA